MAEMPPPETGPVLSLMRSERPKVPALRPDIMVHRRSLPPALHPDLVLLTDPEGVQAARFRSLRHRLVERGDPRVVLVTSPDVDEGKTYVAVNLALAMAEPRRHRVLLVEANMRRPSLADRFDLSHHDHICLLSQLDDHRTNPDLPWQITGVGPTDLHLLVATTVLAEGRRVEAPQFSAAIAQLRAHYDYVIVDGPPALSGADVTFVEDAADSLLLVARAHRTRGRRLRAALDQLLPADLAGVVVVGS